MLKRVSPIKIIEPKIMFAKETVLLASFGGNKNVKSTTEMHLELFTIFIRTKFTPHTILMLVRNRPVKTKKDVTITSLSKRMTFTVSTNLLE
jgi:hypothetical protein